MEICPVVQRRRGTRGLCRAGQFAGEVNMLSGRRGWVRLRASEAGEVIEQAGDHLLGLVHTDGEPSRSSWRAFILRRVETIACAVAPCPPLVSEVWMHCEPGPAGGEPGQLAEPATAAKPDRMDTALRASRVDGSLRGPETFETAGDDRKVPLRIGLRSCGPRCATGRDGRRLKTFPSSER